MKIQPINQWEPMGFAIKTTNKQDWTMTAKDLRIETSSIIPSIHMDFTLRHQKKITKPIFQPKSPTPHFAGSSCILGFQTPTLNIYIYVSTPIFWRKEINSKFHLGAPPSPTPSPTIKTTEQRSSGASLNTSPLKRRPETPEVLSGAWTNEVEATKEENR